MKKNFLLRNTAAAALAALLTIGATAPAFADRDDRWRGGRDHWRHDRHYDRGHYRGHHRGHHRGHNKVVIYTPPRYYAPPRTVVRQTYYAPAPIYTTQPVYSSRVSCTNNTNYVPAVVGGVGGGLIGTQIGKGSGRTAAIISGALIGGLLGHQYSTQDRYCTREVFETGAVGRPVSWNSPETQYAYTVTPMRDYRTEGRYCREYQAVATVGSRAQETYGTACRQPDGSWEIVN